MANVIWILSKLDLRNLIDILLVAGVVYAVLWVIRGTQAVQVLRGVILLALVVAFIGSFAGLTAFGGRWTFWGVLVASRYGPGARCSWTGAYARSLRRVGVSLSDGTVRSS